MQYTDEDSLLNVRETWRPFFEELDEIQQAKEEYLSNPGWVRWGDVPEVPERKSLQLEYTKEVFYNIEWKATF